MEFDPETNTYTSHGPSARLSDNEREIKKLKRAVADLEKRLARVERELKRL
jgi:ubiquinone biosynthesis protein UbiJ